MEDTAKTMNIKQFLVNFEKQNYKQAAEVFTHLSQEDQEQLLKQLYYQAREAKTPVAISVLYRKLHPGKTFEDFYNAWMPAKIYTKPFTVGEKTYHQLFAAPTRVINAINREDPTEIISVGMTWCSEKEFEEALVQVAKADSNITRRDNIAEVADKVSVKMYKVKSDTELGN